MTELNQDESTRYWFKGASICGVADHTNHVEGNWRSVSKNYFLLKKRDIRKFLFFNINR